MLENIYVYSVNILGSSLGQTSLNGKALVVQPLVVYPQINWEYGSRDVLSGYLVVLGNLFQTVLESTKSDAFLKVFIMLFLTKSGEQKPTDLV